MGLANFMETYDTQALLDGICFARLAAVHGHSEDRARLVELLGIAAEAHDRPDDRDLRDMLHAEAIANVSLLADEGVESAGANLSNLMEACSPSAVATSQEIGRMMAEA